MKKVMLIIALIAATVADGYSQNMSCVCKNKAAHKTAHKRTVSKKKTVMQTTTMSQDLVVPIALTNRCVINGEGDFQYQYMSDKPWSGFFPEKKPAAACGSNEAGLTPRLGMLTITSPTFEDGGPLPGKYSCQGTQASPPLNINNIPDETKSLAIVMYDPNATATKSTTYWLMWDMDTTHMIPENFVNDHNANSPYNGQYGYQAICPLTGTHYYHFNVYALDTKLLLNSRTTNRDVLERAMAGHVLAKGEIVGVYTRP